MSAKYNSSRRKKKNNELLEIVKFEFNNTIPRLIYITYLILVLKTFLKTIMITNTYTELSFSPEWSKFSEKFGGVGGAYSVKACLKPKLSTKWVTE